MGPPGSETPVALGLSGVPATSVTAIIAAKDEADRIAATVSAARRIAGVDLVVVVDDGSSDDTARLATRAGAMVVSHPRNRGKAAAMATGARAVADLNRSDLNRSDLNRSDLNRSDVNRSDVNRSDVNRSDVNRSDRQAPGDAVDLLLFVDADLEASAANLAVLIPPVASGQADMTIAVLPPQKVAGGGHGFVVRLARDGIQRLSGWTSTQPLSGMRCLSREAFDAATPLAPGWGVEVGLTIDVLGAGLRVLEVPCDLQHRVTGSDWGGQVHRARQYRDVWLALAARRARATPLVRRAGTLPAVRRVRALRVVRWLRPAARTRDRD